MGLFVCLGFFPINIYMPLIMPQQEIFSKKKIITSCLFLVCPKDKL